MLVGIDGDVDVFVVIEFDGFNFVVVDVDGLVKIFGNIDFVSGCVFCVGMIEDIFG